MPMLTNLSRHYRSAILLFLLLFTLSACAPATVSPTATPLVQTLEVTQVVTRAVTSEVTRLVEVPITNTPTATLDQTATPSLTPTRTKVPSATPTWDPPRVEVLQKVNCWYGPGTAYLFKYGLPQGVWMRAIGRNEDGSWLVIKAPNDPDSNACWIQADQAKFLTGSMRDVPVLWIALPYSVLYLPPKVVTASREGNNVTISWQPVPMTEDDYRGYLVEAWVCQGGKQVLVPIQYATSFDNNSSKISVEVVDEPGCDVPSRARLYTVEKHGYTNYVMVPWPGFDSAASPTATPLDFMNRSYRFLKLCAALAAALFFVVAGSSCSTKQPAASDTPAQPAVATRVVTRLATQQVTLEVTRVVEVPVTVTPVPTLTPTATLDPAMTGAPALPLASLPDYTDCFYGPADYYVYKTSFPAGQQVEVIGRSEDAGWINVEEVGGWNSCWIPAGRAQLQNGNVADLPVAAVQLPRSEYEFGSPTTTAHREGDRVTVSWEAIFMSVDEVQGYLIDAYVCQGGRFIHLPVFVGVTAEQNTGTLTATITDEPGCTEPSRAHIVSVGTRGFAEWEKIFWPPQ
jgi:hypothetical protein